MTTLLEKALSILAPHDCIFCGNEGNIVCAPCSPSLKDERARACHVCGLPSISYAPCGLCSTGTSLKALFVLGFHSGNIKKIITQLKFSGARQVARDTTPLLADLLPTLPENTIISHLPTSHARVRRRGFDQAELIALSLAESTNFRHVCLLSRLSRSRQVGANLRTRQEQARHMFRLCRPDIVQGGTILLVDDVATTMATMEAAARLLRDSGAKNIYGVVISRGGWTGEASGVVV